MPDWAGVYERLRARIVASGVAVRAEQMRLETTGVFDGLSITTNTAYDLETRCHNIAHSFGHIAQWSLDTPRFRRQYDALYAAKADRAAHPDALRRALDHFRAYEEEASQYAAWLLANTASADALPSFTNFARADIEAIVAFHRDGTAPVWHTFFADWNARLARGEFCLRPFEPKPIPPFTPVAIPLQKVIQAVEGFAY
jgi:hypothetical protein